MASLGGELMMDFHPKCLQLPMFCLHLVKPAQNTKGHGTRSPPSLLSHLLPYPRFFQQEIPQQASKHTFLNCILLLLSVRQFQAREHWADSHLRQAHEDFQKQLKFWCDIVPDAWWKNPDTASQKSNVESMDSKDSSVGGGKFQPYKKLATLPLRRRNSTSWDKGSLFMGAFLILVLPKRMGPGKKFLIIFIFCHTYVAYRKNISSNV